jgi:putative membrane protein
MIPKSLTLAVLLAAGLSPSAASAASAAPADRAVMSAAAAVAPAAEPARDARFLRMAHQADMAEIAGGTIAEDRGVSAQVRALGARFVRDHTDIDAHVTATARAAGVTLPDTPTAAQLALAKKYQSVPAAAFDTLFLRTQLKAHTQVLNAGKAELTAGKDPRVKQLIAYAGPLVMAHRDALAGALASTHGGHSH